MTDGTTSNYHLDVDDTYKRNNSMPKTKPLLADVSRPESYKNSQTHSSAGVADAQPANNMMSSDEHEEEKQAVIQESDDCTTDSEEEKEKRDQKMEEEKKEPPSVTP